MSAHAKNQVMPTKSVVPQSFGCTCTITRPHSRAALISFTCTCCFVLVLLFYAAPAMRCLAAHAVYTAHAVYAAHAVHAVIVPVLFRDRATEPSRSQHQPESHARIHDRRRSRETRDESQAAPKHVDGNQRRGRGETSFRYQLQACSILLVCLSMPGQFRWHTRTASQKEG